MTVYYVYSGAGGANDGSSWADAFVDLTTAFAGVADGDVFYVAHDHAESTASAVTLSPDGSQADPTRIICVDRGGSVPPVAADLRDTAEVITTGTSNLSVLGGVTEWYGIIFKCGTGAGNVTLAVGFSGGAYSRFYNCSFRIVATGASSTMAIASSVGSGGTLVELNNTTMSFASASQKIVLVGRLVWLYTESALLGTIPTTLFTPSPGGHGGSIECRGVDFSAAGAGKTLVGETAISFLTTAQFTRYEFFDCKLDASVTKSATRNKPAGNCDVDFVRCGATDATYAVNRNRVSGELNEETTVVRTGGASDGTTTISWKAVTTASCTLVGCFECPQLAAMVDEPGTELTATVQGIWGGGTEPDNDEIWLEVQYLGDEDSTLASFVSDGLADILASPSSQDSSSEVWGGGTTPFALSVTFTPKKRGWVYGRVKIAKPSDTFYIDPMITLT